MRWISGLVGMAALALTASAAQSASPTSLVAECQRIIPKGHPWCVLGRVVDNHTLQVLISSQDLPGERVNVWESEAAENYRPMPTLGIYTGKMVMVSGYLAKGALFHARLLLVPAYGPRKH
jgi:hypothetical protein